jgi:hypothetical protein
MINPMQKYKAFVAYAKDDAKMPYIHALNSVLTWIIIMIMLNILFWKVSWLACVMLDVCYIITQLTPEKYISEARAK